MTHFVAICSKKGGVGKTTVSLNLGVSLQKLGARVLVIDAHFVNPQVSSYLGSPHAGTEIRELITKQVSVAESILTHPSGIHVLPLTGMIPLGSEWKGLLDTLKSAYTTVLIDTNSGIEAERIIEHSDSVLLVTTPDNVAIMQTKRSAEIAEKNKVPLLGAIINKCEDPASLEEVSSYLQTEILTTLPYDTATNKAIDIHYPVVTAYPEADISKSFAELAQYLLGKTTAKYTLQ